MDIEYVKPAEIEEKLVTSYKNNCKKIYFRGAANYKTLEYAVKYCNSFSDRPDIVICTEGAGKEIFSYLKDSYKGNFTIE